MANLKGMFDTTLHKLEQGEVILEPRPYLGMSQIGHECAAYLWYSFRWAYIDTTSKRMTRLWARGHREEIVVANYLREIGCELWDLEDENESQAEYVDCLGHFKGHSDGKIKGVIEAPKTDHLFECKTVKDSGFKELHKKKLEKYSSTYWTQIHLYMKYEKLTRCLHITVNKNDDSFYIERVKYDKGVANDAVRKANSIILSPHPMPRAFPSKTFYKCKWCPANRQCWEGKPLEENCRTCNHSEIAPEGKWNCTKPTEPTPIPVAVQRVGCPYYNAMEN